MPSKSIVGKLNQAHKRKSWKDQINIVREEQKYHSTKTSWDIDALLRHLYKVKFNSQRRHWVLLSILYTPASNIACKHVDKNPGQQ